MTNLKKTLAVVLAFAMILSMGAVSTFAAYSDVEAGTVVSEAVDILSNLEILTGFEDGTFKPEETVTRAQMAAIICRMLGYEDQAQSSMGSTVFNDVAADHWASGYINVAQAQQIINGYGDGNYGPEDKVTYEQAVKMIVSALGYDLAAQAKGGYPTGYLAIASAEGITKSANGKVGDAAARGTIAVLVYNSLEVQLMDQSSWSTGSDGDKYAKTDDTVLSKYLEVTKWEGIVTATPLSLTAAKGQYEADTTPKMQILGKYFYYNNGKLIDKTYVDANDNPQDKVAECDKVDVNGLLGKSVVAYIGEDDYTGNDTVFAISESKNKNTVIKISAEQLVDSTQKYWGTANTIGYTNIGSSRIQDVTLANNQGTLTAKAYVNYKAPQNTIDRTSALANELTRGGVVELISNDADSDIEYIVATSYQREAVVETVEEVNGEYKFNCYKGKLPMVDTEDEDSLVVVYKDGATAEAKDIAANDTVSYVEVADGLEILFVSSATVTGVVDSYDTTDNIVTIGGVDYEISAVSGISAQKLSGEEGTFFLNVDGQIAHNETSPTAVGKYALVLATYDEKTGLNDGSYIQVALADGTIAEYEIDDTAKLVNDDNGTVNNIDTDTEFKAYFTALMTNQLDSNNQATTTWKATAANLIANENLLVKLTVSNDKVTKARLLPAGASASNSGTIKYDEEAMAVGSYDLDDSTIVFSIKETGSTVVDPDKVKVGTVADFFSDESEHQSGRIRVYDEDDNTGVYGALVGCAIEKAVAVDGSVFVVSSKKTTSIDNYEAYVVTGMQNGEEATYTIFNEDGYKDAANNTLDPDSIVAGDVLLIADADAEGIVSEFEHLVKYDKANKTATVVPTRTVDALDEIYSGFGALVDSASNKFYMNAAVSTDVRPVPSNPAIADFAGALAGISYRSNASYTLVDYSENAKNPEVSYEDGSEYLFDTDYVTNVYVRVVDGKLADVVVYRHAEYAGSVSATKGSVVAATPVDHNAEVEFSFDKVNGATTNIAVTAGAATVTGNKVKFDTANSNVTVTVTITDPQSNYVTRTVTFDYTVGA